uniref:RING-type E3 ubiquitin transferase n=2 Tax=Leersia perrieri TaxID=77586 RepID=A0A0D9WQJ5_9ORYZ
MENWGGMTQRLSGKEWVMCSTCSSFVCRKKRTAIPKPDEEVTEGNGLEEAKIEFIKSVGGDRKSKMVTKMLDKKSIDFIKNQPPLKPPLRNSYFTYQHMVDIITPYVEVDRVLLEYLQYHYSINGYAEVQLEVTDDEGSDTQRSEASKSRVSALVYEFLPNGSLEDRLNCVDSTLPLTWLVRIRIIREVCSALIFLHKHNPHPGNILLDANFMSKVSDFGISRVLMESSVNGSNAHFASYAERCSEWPLVQAEQLARIGLQCSALSRQKRPDLQRDVWRVMEPMINEDPAPLSQSFRSMFSESGRAVAMPPFVQSLRFHEILRWQRMASPTKLMILDGWMVGMTHLQQQTKLLQTVTPSRITPCVQPCIKENLHQSKMQELFALG